MQQEAKAKYEKPAIESRVTVEAELQDIIDKIIGSGGGGNVGS